MRPYQRGNTPTDLLASDRTLTGLVVMPGIVVGAVAALVLIAGVAFLAWLSRMRTTKARKTASMNSSKVSHTLLLSHQRFSPHEMEPAAKQKCIPVKGKAVSWGHQVFVVI